MESHHKSRLTQRMHAYTASQSTVTVGVGDPFTRNGTNSLGFTRSMHEKRYKYIASLGECA